MPDFDGPIHMAFGTPPGLEHCLTAMCQNCGWVFRENRELKGENLELRMMLDHLAKLVPELRPDGSLEANATQLVALVIAAAQARKVLTDTAGV